MGERSVVSVGEARSLLGARLRERLPELEAAIATRVYAISDPRQVPDPAYLEGLNAALAAAVDHRIAVLEASERHPPPVPQVLLTQARLDARDGVPVDTVLRRHFAGNAVFGDFLAEEAERAEIATPALRRLLAAQATLFDRLLDAVSSEHAREASKRPTGTIERRRECVKALLAGELVDHSELDYDLDGHHIALMAKGEATREPMREAAAALDRRLLSICREEESIWACWLGGREPISTERVLRAIGDHSALREAVVTVGEPAEGLEGWRFSHRQAKAAMPVAERLGRSPLRYADVAVLASIVRDDLLTDSLHRLYLAPLERSRDRGEAARNTLRAYFDAGRNVSSTAAALGVDRRTVTNRLRAVEELLGRPVSACATDLETALRLDG